METNYKKINSFEAAVVAMMFVGLLIVGAIIFSGLTPRQQVHVTRATQMFDVHEQFRETVVQTTGSVKFVFETSDEFYNQFYQAFTEVASLPAEDFETPLLIARNVSSFLSNLSDQVAANYIAQVQLAPSVAIEFPNVVEAVYESRVLGALLDLTATMPQIEYFIPAAIAGEKVENLEIPYHFVVPDPEPLKSEFYEFINKINKNTHLGRAW